MENIQANIVEDHGAYEINNLEIDTISDLEEALIVIKQLSEQNADLRRRLYTDPKTGVASEQFLNNFLENILNHRLASYNMLSPEDKACAKRHLVLLIDMNGLKQINDNLSYEDGDRAIISVADSLKQGLRTNDYLIRMNSAGDEFILIATLPNGSNVEEAELAITQRVKNLVLNRSNGSLTISVGCASLEDHRSFAETKIEAENAMKNDKDAYYEYNKRFGKVALKGVLNVTQLDEDMVASNYID